MAFVSLIAVSGAVPANAVTPAASSSAGQDVSGVPAQTLKVSAAATNTIQRDGYTSAAAPKPKPKPKPTAVAGVQAVGGVGGGQGWTLPISGPVSSPFGARPGAPVPGVKPFHDGADIPAPCGAPVRAAQSGTVVEAGTQGSYGNWILVDHGNGIQTGYAHSSEILVATGQHVDAGATIALVGTTGASSGCHVHFETRVDGAQIDPAQFMSTQGIGLG